MLVISKLWDIDFFTLLVGICLWKTLCTFLQVCMNDVGAAFFLFEGGRESVCEKKKKKEGGRKRGRELLHICTIFIAIQPVWLPRQNILELYKLTRLRLPQLQ